MATSGGLVCSNAAGTATCNRIVNAPLIQGCQLISLYKGFNAEGQGQSAPNAEQLSEALLRQCSCREPFWKGQLWPTVVQHAHGGKAGISAVHWGRLAACISYPCRLALGWSSTEKGARCNILHQISNLFDCCVVCRYMTCIEQNQALVMSGHQAAVYRSSAILSHHKEATERKRCITSTCMP